jgi:lipoyl(octanoyl) transferase
MPINKMKDTWRLLVTPPARGSWNMAVDEAILEGIGAGTSPATLRLYAWEPACLSLGYAQPLSDVDLPRLQSHGWDLVRRPTGGRAVLHTDELTYSVIAPTRDARVAGSLLESYHRLAQALVKALELLVLPVKVQERAAIPASRNSNPVCFEVPSTYEITVDGRKLVGSAQARRKEGVLQHGTLPLTGDLTRILDCLVFPDEAARSQAAERLLTRATTVETALGRPVSWEEAAGAFANAFRSVFDLELQPGDLSDRENSRAGELSTGKYSHPEWTQKTNG